MGDYIVAEKTLEHAAPLHRREGDGGIDVSLPQNIIIPGNRSMKVDIGWAFQLPEGWHMLAIQKSRHAGYFLVEAPLIDHSYRGSVHAVLHNLEDTDQPWFKGDKIMQLLPVYSPHMPLIYDVVDKNTERGDGAFGSTG